MSRVCLHPQRQFLPRAVWYRSWFAGGLLAGALLAASACDGKAASKGAGETAAALPVNVMKVEPLEVRREVEAVGTLAAHEDTVVSAEVEGRVRRLAADMGDHVAAGAPLVILDAEKLQYRADEQRAALEQARARLGARGAELPPPAATPDVMSAAAQRAEAQQRLGRARQLAEKKLVSTQDLERAQTELETATAAHEAALAAARHLRAELTGREAALNGATRALHDAVIRAPFEGVVAERLVSPGQYVRVQTPVVRLVRLHPLRLKAEIPERFGPAIRIGHALSVKVDAYPDRAVDGRVTRISPDVNTTSRAFTIEGDVPNADGSLMPGAFARVRILTDRVDRIVAIPTTAVQTRYGRALVFVVRGGVLAATEVKLGDRLGQRVEVLDGLEAGASIVADDVEALQDGLPVVARAGAPTSQGGDR
ncbi:MAG: efflux RND transporter periplasmic adaptor subunit [Acidobacteria bacterium]|nr:efflux RND transporter periplasmic adaptor subunit [Acidobacteriota bacterium]